MNRQLVAVTSVVTSLALVATSSSLPLLSQTPEPCVPQRQDSTSVQAASARAVVGGREFTIDMRSAGAPAGSQVHMLVRRGAAPSMDLTVNTSARGELEIHMLLGDGFRGPKEFVFTSADRKTLTGTIDGRAIAPFELAASPETMKLADGSPPPSGSADEDVKQALPKLLEAVHAQCSAGAPLPQKRSALLSAIAGGGDPPGHRSHPNESAGCILCLTASFAGLVACMVAAAAAAAACLFFYPICFALGVAVCVAAFYITVCTGCHDTAFGNTCGGGGPCCPVACGQGRCCDDGETCVGPNGLCCSPGFRGCGTSLCCGPGETCLGDLACCPNAQVCGTVCCAKSQSCSDPNNGVCSPCSNCSAPNQQCCFGECCTSPAFCNTLTRRCDIIP